MRKSKILSRFRRSYMASLAYIFGFVLCNFLGVWSTQAAEPSVSKGALPGLPDGVKQGPTVEGITEYQLKNGLRILLAPEPSKPTTTVNITYLVGSHHENYGETGMAHLLEHLVFKGTPGQPDIKGQLDKRGLRFNGTTWYDRTNYYETFPVSDSNLEWALKMEADRMVNSFIAKKDLDTEMTVVRNEFEMNENDSLGTLYRQLTASVFHWHNYGKSPIGARSDIENVAIENLQAFYRKYYQPDNAVLTVAGQFDPVQTLTWIKDYFGPIPRPTQIRPRFYTVEPIQEGEREIVLRRGGGKQMLAVAYRTPSGSHADAGALSLLTSILGSTPDGRLHKALVEKKLAVEVGADFQGLADPDFLAFFVMQKEDQDLAAAKSQALQLIENIQKNPITAEEVQLARKKTLNQIEQITRDPEKLGIALSEAIALGDWRLFFLNRDRIAEAKLADVQKAAENYFQRSNRTLGIFIPTNQPGRAVIPDNPDITKLVENYRGKKEVVSGEAFEATPDNIEKNTLRKTLPNGLQIAFLPKKTRGETVSLTFKLNLGSEEALFDQYPAGTLLASLLDRGTQHKNRQQLQKMLEELNTKLQIHGDERGVSLVAETTREHLLKVLPLLIEIVKEPALSPSELEIARNEWIANLAENQQLPQGVAREALNRLLAAQFPAKHVLAAKSLAEQMAAIKEVSLEKIKAFHQQFYGFSSAQLAIVGDFDPESAETLLKKSLEKWPSKTPYQHINNPHHILDAQQVKLETPDKANAVFLAAYAFPLQDTDAEHPAILIANHVLGGGGFSARLLKRLREKEGISYGAGTSLAVGSQDSRAVIVGQAIFAPQNREKLIQAFNEEVALFVREGITNAELEDAKTALLQQRKLQRAQDDSLAFSLAEQLRLNRTMALSATIDGKIGLMTTDVVNRAIKKYLSSSFAIVTAGDFTKK